MAVTAPTTARLVGAVRGAWSGVRADGRDGEVRPPTSRTGALLLGALMAAVTFAVFAHGATSYPAEARLQVALTVLAAGAVAAWLWRAPAGVSAEPAAWAGVGLLGAFAAWSGLSLAWSIAPSGTWLELNRAIAYALVVALALAAASWYPRALERCAVAYAAIAVAVALYALGGKIAPDLHLGGLIDLNQTSTFSRLRAPLQYWNALALFCVMAVPIVLRLAVDSTRGRAVRLGGLCALTVLAVTIGLTYSRGGVLAFVVAVAVSLALGGARLRSLMYVTLALAAAAPALVVGFTSHDLTTNGVSLAQRRGDGVLLGALLAVSLLALVLGGRSLIALERRVSPDRARSRRVGLALAAVVAVAALTGVGAMALSERGLGGTVAHQWKVFRTPKTANPYDPARLLTTTSGNRWVWWSEAVGAWSDRPLEGWGAGSFPVLHREYRRNQLDVLQPHSVPLQLLAETGLVGAALALGGVLLLAAGGLASVRRMAPGPRRGLAAALYAGALAWLFHGLYDWDWDIPGVTVPALLFLGLVGARRARARGPAELPLGASRAPRALGVAAVTLLLACVAVSAALPSLASSQTSSALSSVSGNAGDARLRRAQQRFELAARVDPLTVAPLLAASSIAQRRGLPLEASRYLIDAVRRQPRNSLAWYGLASAELVRGDLANVGYALGRGVELDPRSRAAPLIVALRNAALSPPSDSATATGTPLVAVVGDGRGSTGGQTAGTGP